MLLRHIASSRAANHVRSNFPAFSGVRVFSSGRTYLDAPKQQPGERNLVRKVSHGSRSAKTTHKGNTASTPRVRRDEIDRLITVAEYNEWIRTPLFYSYPKSLGGIKIDSTQLEQIGAKLPEHLRRDPLSAFTDSPDALSLSVATAGDCMQLYLFHLLEETLRDDKLVKLLRAGHLGWDDIRRGIDQDKCRRRLADDNAGTRAVLWLLNSAQHETLEVTYDFRFFQTAAFCIVG